MLHEETALGPALQTNPLRNGNHEAGEAPIITMNGAPLRNIFRHLVTNLLESRIFTRNPSHRQASGVMNTSQQGLSAVFNTAVLENGDAKYSPSAPNSPQFRTGKVVLRPTTGQASRPSKRRPATIVRLGQVHSSKASTGALKKGPEPKRRLSISKNVPFDGLKLTPCVDTSDILPSPASAGPAQK